MQTEVKLGIPLLVQEQLLVTPSLSYLVCKRNTERHGRLEGLCLVCSFLVPGGELAKIWIKIFLAVFLLTSLICSKINFAQLYFKLQDQGLFDLVQWVQSVHEYLENNFPDLLRTGLSVSEVTVCISL